MNRSAMYLMLFLTALVSSATLWADQGSNEAEPISREESAVIEILATVSAIDYETREVELKDAQGNVRVITADPRVKRLEDLQVGDQVNVDIVVSALAEVRAPTAEELANPGAITRGVVRSEGSGAMAGSMVESQTSIVTIVGLNLLNESITIQTTEGALVDVRAQNIDNLKKLRLGDTVVISYSQSIAISVEEIGSANVD